VRAPKVSPAAVPMHAEGWKAALMDLRRVSAFQPSVVTDQSLAHVSDADGADLESLAAVTLPLTQGEEVPLQYDPIRMASTAASANPNLRIAAQVGPLPVARPVRPGLPADGGAVVHAGRPLPRASLHA
jgi:hypothetical protein